MDTPKITLKDWADEDKPREKMCAKGKKNLSNAELLAILLGSGSRGQSAVGLAKDILKSSDNSLLKLSKNEIHDLTNFKGMGPAKAITIVAAMELGIRLFSEGKVEKDTPICNSEALFNHLSPLLVDLPTEEFWVIYLGIRNKIIHTQRISLGGVSETAVDIRQVFRPAFEKNAVSIALAHNHPSGFLEPSRQDKALTISIQEAGKLLRINVMDHLILGIDASGKPNYYSFHDSGLL